MCVCVPVVFGAVGHESGSLHGDVDVEQSGVNERVGELQGAKHLIAHLVHSAHLHTAKEHNMIPQTTPRHDKT